MSECRCQRCAKDGKIDYYYSAEYMAECEIKSLVRLFNREGKEAIVDYLKGVIKSRGEQAAKSLDAKLTEAIEKGIK